MDDSLPYAVEDFRRRLADLQREVQRLRSLVLELESAGSLLAEERRAKSSLRRAQADLARAQEEVAELQRIYARFRLREGLGPDPEALDDALVDAELLAFCQGPLSRRLAFDAATSAVGFATCRQMLLAGLSLDELTRTLRTARSTGGVSEVGDARAATHAVLRRWAALTEADPYVAERLARARAAADRYTQFLAGFLAQIESVRINYEIKQRTADRLGFTLEGDRCVLRADNDWANVEAAFPREAERLAEQFDGLRRATQELTAARDELNGQLRTFMASLAAMYLTYVSRQSRERRQQLGLAGESVSRLGNHLLDEIEGLDFLLPSGGGFQVPLPRIPRELAPFTRTAAYRQHAKPGDGTDDARPSPGDAG
jgi:hypothetical protein